jgi:hypothetical protein
MAHQSRSLGYRSGSRLDLPVGTPLLADTTGSNDQTILHRHPPSCGRGGDRKARPGAQGSAATRCDRPRPEDRGRRATGQAGSGATRRRETWATNRPAGSGRAAQDPCG